MTINAGDVFYRVSDKLEGKVTGFFESGGQGLEVELELMTGEVIKINSVFFNHGWKKASFLYKTGKVFDCFIRLLKR